MIKVIFFKGLPVITSKTIHKRNQKAIINLQGYGRVVAITFIDPPPSASFFQ